MAMQPDIKTVLPVRDNVVPADLPVVAAAGAITVVPGPAGAATVALLELLITVAAVLLVCAPVSLHALSTMTRMRIVLTDSFQLSILIQVYLSTRECVCVSQ